MPVPRWGQGIPQFDGLQPFTDHWGKPCPKSPNLYTIPDVMTSTGSDIITLGMACKDALVWGQTLWSDAKNPNNFAPKPKHPAWCPRCDDITSGWSYHIRDLAGSLPTSRMTQRPPTDAQVKCGNPITTWLIPRCFLLYHMKFYNLCIDRINRLLLNTGK